MNTAFEVKAGSVHHKILVRLCSAPKAVQGMSEGMLNRVFGEPRAIEELAAARLIRRRGWHDGPGEIWVPTEDGEAVFASLTGSGDGPG